MDEKGNSSKSLILTTVGFLALMNFSLSLQVSRLNDRMDNLFNEIHYMNDRVESSISGISYSVSEALEKESSLINYFKFEYGPINNGKATLKLVASPKEISDESEYFFSYFLDGDERLVEAKIDELSEIVASIEVPIRENLDINFIVKDGDSRKIENLDYIYSLEEKLVGPFEFENSGAGFTYLNQSTTVELDGVSYSLIYDQYEYEENYEKQPLEDVNLYIEVNGSVVDKFPMERQDNRMHDIMSFYVCTLEKYSLKLEPGDDLKIYALAKHSDGYTVKIIANSLSVDANGNPDFDVDYIGDGKSIVDL